MFTKKTIRDVDLSGKTVLLRADFNVPVENGKITDDYRITQALPTINYILEHNAKLIIVSHLGRPEGRVRDEFSLFPVAKRLHQMLDRQVEFARDCVGEQAIKAAKGLKLGQVLLLENLRFHAEEEANNDSFAKQLAELADVFVQDGFGVVHRAHASTDAITKHLPSVAGLLLEKEVDTLTNVMSNPERPLMGIVGGAKIADKIEILHRFIEIADFVAVGGAMANTFLAANGVDVAKSLYDKNELSVARDIMHKAADESKKRKFIFAVPHDAVVAEGIDKAKPTRIVDWGTHILADIESYPRKPKAEAYKIKPSEQILDIGPFSASFIAGAVQFANTVVWNGAMGVTETEGLQGTVGPYSHGTEVVVDAILGEFGHKPFSVVGGGDTVGFLQTHGLLDHFNHVSTGGGASLELLAGRKLPGVEALGDKASISNK